jgi:HigB_toxin, RelE-like toxic component of a toxin-antitoxin system
MRDPWLYATASVVSGERIVFNIKGNDYRLVVAVDFEKGIVCGSSGSAPIRLRSNRRPGGTALTP